VDSTTYYNSYRYYMNNVKEMDQIYAAVVDSLSLRENSIK
jgi:tRNA uridine 5-carbamoylmethylation protein Kti12